MSTKVVVPRGKLYWGFLETLRMLSQLLFSQLRAGGEEVVQFEEALARMLGAEDVRLVAKARVALKIVLEANGACEGDKILMSPITVRPMLDVVLSLGMLPVFFDLKENDVQPDMDSFEKGLGSGPRFALFTPLFGQAANYGPYFSLAKHQNCITVLDASQVLHSHFQGLRIWEGADYVIASLSALKTIDTVGGGVLFSPSRRVGRDEEGLIESLASPNKVTLSKLALRNLVYAIYAIGPITRLAILVFRIGNRFSPGWALRQTGTRRSRPIIGFAPSIFAGYSQVQARFGLQALQGWSERVAERRDISVEYERLINKSDCDSIHVVGSSGSLGSDYWQFAVIVNNPQDFQEFMWRRGIDVGSTSLSFLPRSRPGLEQKSELKSAERLYSLSVFLPNHPSLSHRQRESVRNAVNEWASLESR